MKSNVFIVAFAVCVLALGQASLVRAIISAGHVTDGQFGPNEWEGPNAPSTIVKTVFPANGVSGNSVLYVDQGSVPPNGPRTLWLMYDWTGSNQSQLGPPNFASSFFDVFFDVGDDSYLVRVSPGINNFQAFEKPEDVIAPISPDGTFNPLGSPWTPLPGNEAAQLHSALGPAAPSPNSSLPHLFAEFDVTIDGSDPAFPGFGGQPGVYSPAPAFWSAGGKNGNPNDPPISSAIFTLHPDGTTTVEALIGANGPFRQPQDVPTPTPEPLSAGLSLAGLGAVILAGLARRRG